MRVLVCADLGGAPAGLDLQALEGWLATRSPGTSVRRIVGPCTGPEGWAARAGARGDRVVLAVCAAPDRAPWEASLRRRGVDPLAVAVVPLGRLAAAAARERATRRAGLLLMGALARLGGYGGCRPEQLKPVLADDRPLSRRALLTLPPVRYEVVPAVRHAACAAEEGCHLCVDACPRAALAVGPDGRLGLERGRCTGCGVCAAACPRGALDLPGADPLAVERQVDALLGGEPEAGPRGLVFACRDAAPAAGPDGEVDWLPVEVPCAGMVPAAWLLAALARGAAGVAVQACGRPGCRAGRPDLLDARVGYCQALLAAVGGSPDLVRLLTPSTGERLEPPAAAPRVRGAVVPLAGPSAAAAAVRGVAARFGGGPDRGRSVRVAHPGSPLGVVELAAGCTACGACAAACPTGALALASEGPVVALSFEPAACVACAGCVAACPERVLRVERVTDLARLAAGRQALRRDDTARCRRCGGPVAPRALLERVGGLLAGDPVLATLTRYCAACRGSGVPVAAGAGAEPGRNPT